MGGKIKDLTGRRFGICVVLRRAGYDRHGSTLWEYQCDCGNIKKTQISALSKMESCGCLRNARAGLRLKGNRYNRNADPQEPSWRAAYGRFLFNAKKRYYKAFLSKEEYKNIVSKRCYLCGNQPSRIFSNYLNKDGSIKKRLSKYRVTTEWAQKSIIIINGIDRINNEPFYKIENSVPCCPRCNFLKRDLTYEEFMQYINISPTIIYKIYSNSRENISLDELTKHIEKIRFNQNNNSEIGASAL